MGRRGLVLVVDEATSPGCFLDWWTAGSVARSTTRAVVDEATRPSSGSGRGYEARLCFGLAGGGICGQIHYGAVVDEA